MRASLKVLIALTPLLPHLLLLFLVAVLLLLFLDVILVAVVVFGLVERSMMCRVR